MARVIAVMVFLAVLGSTWIAENRLEDLSANADQDQELLYLPNGRLLKVMSLGHGGLLADAFYIWAIQYYSNYGRSDRYRYVDHVFDGVITELDPHYVDAYWLGALILIIEAQDVEAGLDLLQKGIDHNPDKWILPYLAGWEAHHAGLFDRAAGYFETASKVPDAPQVVKRMQVGMLAKSGNLREAARMWQELLEDPAADEASMAIARRKLAKIRVQLDVEQLQAAVARFRNENARLPTRLEELVSRGYISSLPRDPEGRAYLYDRGKGQVLTPEGRILGG